MTQEFFQVGLIPKYWKNSHCSYFFNFEMKYFLKNYKLALIAFNIYRRRFAEDKRSLWPLEAGFMNAVGLSMVFWSDRSWDSITWVIVGMQLRLFTTSCPLTILPKKGKRPLVARVEWRTNSNWKLVIVFPSLEKWRNLMSMGSSPGLPGASNSFSVNSSGFWIAKG